MTYLDQYTSLIDRNRRARNRVSVRAASISSRASNSGHSRPNSRPTSANEDGYTSTASNKSRRSRKKLKDEKENSNLFFDQSSCILSSREAQTTYLVLVICLHFILLSIPFFTTPLAWTLTNFLHAVSTYYVLHHCKGSPFSRHNQDKYRRYTYWEQLDNETDEEFVWSSTRKFFIVIPSILYICAQFYSMKWHTAINVLALLISIGWGGF